MTDKLLDESCVKCQPLGLEEYKNDIWKNYYGKSRISCELHSKTVSDSYLSNFLYLWDNVAKTDSFVFIVIKLWKFHVPYNALTACNYDIMEYRSRLFTNKTLFSSQCSVLSIS